MARIWSSYKDAEEAVNTIKTMYEKTGGLPKVLVKNYNVTLNRSYRGVVQKFYELLARDCPEVLEYFSEPEKYDLYRDNDDK